MIDPRYQVRRPLGRMILGYTQAPQSLARLPVGQIKAGVARRLPSIAESMWAFQPLGTRRQLGSGPLNQLIDDAPLFYHYFRFQRVYERYRRALREPLLGIPTWLNSPIWMMRPGRPQ